MSLAAKPIKKVAEARARKKKRLLSKMRAAKTAAASVVNNPEMTHGEKMRSIAKTMRGAAEKKGSKVYVVSRRGGAKAAGKGGVKGAGKGAKVKMVDSRMRADTFRVKQREKKRRR